MSGTGKSTALAELGRRGFRVVDTDDPPWSEWSEDAGGYVWREDLVADLLEEDDARTLYVSGTVSNQGRFYPRFDAVVLLSAPAEVLLRRIETRTTNDYGKTPAERALVIRAHRRGGAAPPCELHARDRRSAATRRCRRPARRDRLRLGALDHAVVLDGRKRVVEVMEQRLPFLVAR